ncbi:MAG TPA: hypothetical protein VJU77_09765 [Chthoniobacterales bacterium]|nr:hypothetical protein [Chthoniobacterales bacterium]
MTETEIRTLHFDLAHLPSETKLWLSAGGNDYPLVAHTEATLREAQATNQALRLIPASNVTHYVKDVALPARSPQLLMVHSPSRVEGSLLPTLEMTHIHLPTAARQRAVELRHRHREHPSHQRPLAKLGDHGVDSQDLSDPVIIHVHDWVTAMDAAVTLVFFHQEMMSLDAEAAAIVHLQIEYSNGISDLAASILQQARAHARDPKVQNYVYEGSYLDPTTMQPNGEPCYLWTTKTATWAQGPMVSALRDTKNDPFLESTEERPGVWSVEPGTTWGGLVGTQKGFAETENAAQASSTGWTLVNLTAGHGLEVGDLSFDLGSLTLPLKNNWLRWLSVYAQFLDADGKPYNPPDWKPIPPGENYPTKKYIGLLASAATILAIPLPSSFENLVFPMPSGASKVNYFAGGLGRVNGIDGVGQWDREVCAMGTAMTSIFNLGMPTIGIVAGFSISLSSLNEVAKLALDEISIFLSFYFQTKASEQLGKGGSGTWLALADSLVRATIAASPALSAWIIAKFSEAAAKKAAPIIGWIATAVSTAADAALLIQTSVEVAQSPATFTLTAERKMDVDVTMLPDVNHQNQWPATATHYRVSAQYSPADLKNGSSGFVFNAMYDDNGTKTVDFPMTVMEGPIKLLMKGAPAGGTLTLIVSFYSNTNWLCGHYKSNPTPAMPGPNNTLVIPQFNITEELVPLNPDTYYAPKLELIYKNGVHQWAQGRFDIRTDVTLLTVDLDANAVTPALKKAFLDAGHVTLSLSDSVITTRRSTSGKGDQWLITSSAACYHVNLIRPAGAASFLEVTTGNTATIKNLSGSNIGHNLATLVKVTFSQSAQRLGYTWQASGQEIPLVTGGGVYSGQMFTFQGINAGSQPETGLKFVPAGFPTRPVLIYDLYGPAGDQAFTYYIDPRDELYHVRRVNLSKAGPFDLATGSSYGRFNQQIDGAAVHPNGYVVGFNLRNCKIEALPLLKAARPDAEAPLANLYSGNGSRPGLIHNPAAVTVTPNGTVLVLENPTETSEGRVQALDYLADPVNAFEGGTSPYLRLKIEQEKVTYLDIASEVGGYIYVLKYLGEGNRVQDYRLDIYAPNGLFVSQSTAVNAGKMCVSLWRELFTFNFNIVAGPGGRTEPSVSEWIPSTPQGSAATGQATRS